jgi:hypothetical protein
MRCVILVGMVATAACGKPQEPPTGTSASVVEKCSASMGPVSGTVGPSDTLVDAGDVQTCGPGGKCTYLTAPFPGARNFSPGWACVFASGSASQGTDGPQSN